VVAEQYFQPQLSEIIFEQACMLAKRVFPRNHHPLTEQPSTPSSSQEAEEGLKAWTSLFVRDKSLSLFRGRVCSLPAFDWCPVVPTQLYNSRSSGMYVPARIALARIQEQTYFFLYSREAAKKSLAQRAAYFLVLDDRLRHWAETNSSVLSEERIHAATDLHLAFRSTRVMALRSSPDSKHKETVLQDSRIICRLLATAGIHNGSLQVAVPLHM
jgi:hypothetical protein